MTNEQAGTPQQLLEQIRSFIEVTKVHVSQGGDVDLSGLDEKVRELCEAVLDMPKPEADDYAVALQELADDLTALKTGMEVVQKDVRQQLDVLNLRQKAAKAYKTSDAAKPPAQDKDQ